MSGRTRNGQERRSITKASSPAYEVFPPHWRFVRRPVYQPTTCMILKPLAHTYTLHVRYPLSQPSDSIEIQRSHLISRLLAPYV